jgi:DNA-binding NarL/FixJ family response regulator
MPITVLVVDDHEGFRLRARALLEAEGFDVIGEAEDGRSALEAADRLHPDLAIVDVQLPDIDGFEVAERLHAARSARNVILISGREREDYGARVDRSPARGFIPKVDLSGARLLALLG